MLQQFCRRGRIDALLHDGTDDAELARLLDLLHLDASQDEQTHPRPAPTSTQIAEMLRDADDLSASEYGLLLAHLRKDGQPWRDRTAYPHPLAAAEFIVPSAAVVHSECNFFGRTFSCARSHDGNSAIEFYNYERTTSYTGVIEALWDIPLRGVVRSFALVRPHKPLPHHEELKGPFHARHRFRVRLVAADPSEELIVIEHAQIIAHAVVYPRPAGTYGINHKILAVCTALNRGRR
ncbi:hypothetical protein EXIGLDRAFT_611659 [Exidia glandulosa HHB12029]|uniref:Uncharacterized protein n=1 Tax=Exidia glandulosa HHB12029 TaxID=1314781 RepID=A0A165J962_EXIGL|nr:hypothetical protein EXIGLDRAFT_611659 [Exidia glandulosa HHB12029]